METGEDVLASEEGEQGVLNDVEVGASESTSGCSPRRSQKKKGSRKVSFPDDARLVRALDPVDPWKNAGHHSSKDVIDAYRNSCLRLRIKPCDKLIKQLEACESFKDRINVIDLRAPVSLETIPKICTEGLRGPPVTSKIIHHKQEMFRCQGKGVNKFGVKLDSRNCEALEEVFRRVRTKTLDLENTGLEDDAAVSVLEMIEYYKTTWKLNLAYNSRIKIRGWQAVCRTVKKASCLEYLDIRNTVWTEQALPLLGRSLRLDCCLTVLHMESTNLSGRPLFLLASAVKFNRSLKDLFLGDNKLISSDGQCLGAMLKGNQTLQLLDLRNNPLQDMGLGHICEGLSEQQNGGLQTLVLWNTQVTQLGMGYLANALVCTNFLQTLNLGHNRLTNEGIHTLKEGLLRNHSLQRIGLLNTRLSSEGMIALAEVIADSKSILRLDLRENDPFVGGLMALALALKVNQSLVRIDLDKEMKKEPGMETTQRILLADIYGYCQRNKILAKELEERGLVDESQAEEGVTSETDSIIHDVTELESGQQSTEPGGCQAPVLGSPRLIRLESPPDIEEELRVLAADFPGQSRFRVTTICDEETRCAQDTSEKGRHSDAPLVAAGGQSDPMPLIDLSCSNCLHQDTTVTTDLPDENVSNVTLDETNSALGTLTKINKEVPGSETPSSPGEFEKELDSMLASVTLKGANHSSLSCPVDSKDFWTHQVDGIMKGSTNGSTPPSSVRLSNSTLDFLG